MPHAVHTLHLIRQLTAIGSVRPRKRIGRIPRPLPPTAIENAYHAALVRYVCNLARECVMVHWPEIESTLMMERRGRGTFDSGGYGQAAANGARAAKLLDRAGKLFAEKFNPRAMKDVVRQFGKRTDYHSRLQLDQQLRSAIGVPLGAIEKPTRDRIEGWAAKNVDLIVTVPSRYFDRLRLDVEDAIEQGTHPSTLADEFEERYEISKRDAERIARSEVLMLNSDITRGRMEALGVTRAVWRSVMDNRTSEDCAILDGQEFDLSEGIGGVFPGFEHPACRCWSEPLLDDLING